MGDGRHFTRTKCLFYRIMKGGAETGFRHVSPREYQPRLLHFRKEGGHIVLKEVFCLASGKLMLS